MNMKLTDIELEILREAYTHIESPCLFCPHRQYHHCALFSSGIVEDSPDVFIPCAECEDIAAENNF